MDRTQAVAALDLALDSDFLKALAEPARVEILKVLMVGGSLDIGEISDQLPQERSVISRHLKMLSAAGLVRSEKRGRHRFYSLDPATFVGRLEGLVAAARTCIAACCPSELPDDSESV